MFLFDTGRNTVYKTPKTLDDLPREIITHIFSFLSIEDRMRARVNTNTTWIELRAKYRVNSLTVFEGKPASRNQRSSRLINMGDQLFAVDINQTVDIYSEGLKKIAHNTKFKKVDVR
ncbi:hypothetical protein PFISCL1PPCAC_19312, partial [Pristionchus fissidentatus]